MGIYGAGSIESKIIMVKALSEMELTDYSKATLFDGGVLEPLLHVISEDYSAEFKQVAVKALQNLSSLPRIGLQMIQGGAVDPLLSLVHFFTSSQSLREHAAATIMNLAMSATSPEAGGIPVTLLESDDDIYRLFSLINLTQPNVQQSILRTFHAMCQHPSATDVRAKLRQVDITIAFPLSPGEV
ncbi:hypothetical protein ACLOJK_006232 [Asimina triloba]